MDRQDFFASIHTNVSFASVVVDFRHCGPPKSSPDHATAFRGLRSIGKRVAPSFLI